MEVGVFHVFPVLTHALIDQDIQSFNKFLAEGVLFLRISTMKGFFSSSSAYWNGVMFDGCTKGLMSSSVFIMTSTVAYFFSKMLETWK